MPVQHSLTMSPKHTSAASPAPGAVASRSARSTAAPTAACTVRWCATLARRAVATSTTECLFKPQAAASAPRSAPGSVTRWCAMPCARHMPAAGAGSGRGGPRALAAAARARGWQLQGSGALDILAIDENYC